MDILIVGSIALDFVKTPFAEQDNILGGSCTYCSISAAYFNENCAIVGVVGEDFPKEYIELFNDKGIDLTGLQIIENGKTFRWGGSYHNDMKERDTLFTHLNVFENFNPIIPDIHKNPNILLLGNIDPSLQLKVLDQISNTRFTIIDTMNLWLDIKRREVDEVVKKADLLVINDSEAAQMTGINNTIKAGKKLIQNGLKYLIIKKGEHGALLFGKDKLFSAPAFPVEDVFDPTGAGDAFAGGLAGYLSKTVDITFEELKKGIIYGTVMASFSIESFSTKRIESLNKNEIEERYRLLKEISGF